MHLYNITHNVEGVSISFKIVSSGIAEAIEESNRQASLKVGDNYKRDALSGEYLKKIEKTEVIICEESHQKTQIKFGCHVDLLAGECPDNCVIDYDDHDDCTHAVHGMKREDCEFWEEIETNEEQ